MDEKTLARFWEKVDKSGPLPDLAPELGNCWIWTSGVDNRGRGKFWADDASHCANRVSWELHNALPAPKGHHVIYICGVPRCVNPAHLSTDLTARRRKRVSPPRSSALLNCPQCGKEFRMKLSKIRRNLGRFCGDACWRAWDAQVSSDLTGAIRRFWARVNKAGPVPSHVPDLGPCWIWDTKRNAAGYGVFWFRRRNEGAHRFSFETTYGELPRAQHVCHKCDNPPCVRPDHLFAGDVHDNVADRDAKHRQAKGTTVGTSRMTEADVIRIFELRSQGLTQPAIAKRIGFSNQTVSNVLRGYSWKHVSRHAAT